MQIIRPTANTDGVWHIHIDHFGEIGEDYRLIRIAQSISVPSKYWKLKGST